MKLPSAPASYDQNQMQKILAQIEDALNGKVGTNEPIIFGGRSNTIKGRSPDGNLHTLKVDNAGTLSTS